MEKDINAASGTPASAVDASKPGMGSFALLAGLVAVAAGLYYTSAQSSASVAPDKLPPQSVVCIHIVSVAVKHTQDVF